MYPSLTLYDMVDVGGLDLADVAGKTYSGLYNKLSVAMHSEYDVVLYNWYCAEILLPPADVTLAIDSNNFISINGIIFVRPNDTVFIPSMGVLPVIEQLSVTENGTYIAPTGVDGYTPVDVNVPEPVLEELSVTSNGTYIPVSADGFSKVDVNVEVVTYPFINYAGIGTLYTRSDFDLYGLNSTTDRIKLLDANANPLVINWSLPFHIKLTVKMNLLTRTQVLFGSDQDYRGAPAIHVGSSTYGNIWFAGSTNGSSWNWSLNFQGSDLSGFVWGNVFEVEYIYDGSKVMCSVTQGDFRAYKETLVSGFYSNGYSTCIGWVYSTNYSATTLHLYADKSFIKSNGVLVWGAE